MIINAVFVISLFILNLSTTAIAATEDLINIVTCKYDTYSDETGNTKVKKEFALEFWVDSKTGDYYLKGNQGIGKIQYLKSLEGFNFIETTGTGNLMLTTIDSNGRSVHSRHTIMGGEIVPTQYYGNCMVNN